MNKLSSKEATAIIVNLVCAKTFLMVPVYFKRITESGSIVTVLYVFALAFIFLFLRYVTPKIKLKALYPLIGLAMLVVCSINIFEYSMTISSLFFKNTPFLLIIIFFWFAMVFGAYGNIGKINLFFTPVIYSVVFLMLIFTFSGGNYYYLFPVLGKGFDSIFKEGFFMLSSLFELVVLFFIPEMLKDKKDFKKVFKIREGI